MHKFLLCIVIVFALFVGSCKKHSSTSTVNVPVTILFDTNNVAYSNKYIYQSGFISSANIYGALYGLTPITGTYSMFLYMVDQNSVTPKFQFYMPGTSTVVTDSVLGTGTFTYVHDPASTRPLDTVTFTNGGEDIFGRDYTLISDTVIITSLDTSVLRGSFLSGTFTATLVSVTSNKDTLRLSNGAFTNALITPDSWRH